MRGEDLLLLELVFKTGDDDRKEKPGELNRREDQLGKEFLVFPASGEVLVLLSLLRLTRKLGKERLRVDKQSTGLCHGQIGLTQALALLGGVFLSICPVTELGGSEERDTAIFASTNQGCEL